MSAEYSREATIAKRSRASSKRLPGGLSIIYEDESLLIVDKPSGMLTIGTDVEKLRTAYFAMTDYVRHGQQKSRKRIFIVHRLDRETSGILVFAKNKETKFRLQDQWKETKKKYLAVVHGKFKKRSGTITSYLTENKSHFVYSTRNTQKGKQSQTSFIVLKETKDFSMLEVAPVTGRKHQIRVHLAENGHPVVGDRRYGGGKKTFKRMALHALSISFRHPVTGRQYRFETSIPPYFSTLIGSPVSIEF